MCQSSVLKEHKLQCDYKYRTEKRGREREGNERDVRAKEVVSLANHLKWALVLEQRFHFSQFQKVLPCHICAADQLHIVCSSTFVFKACSVTDLYSPCSETSDHSTKPHAR